MVVVVVGQWHHQPYHRVFLLLQLLAATLPFFCPSSTTARAFMNNKYNKNPVSRTGASSWKYIHKESSLVASVLSSLSSSSCADDSNNQQPSSRQQQRQRNTNGTYSAKFLSDNGLIITQDEKGYVTARPAEASSNQQSKEKRQRQHRANNNNDDNNNNNNKVLPIKEDPATVVPQTGFNVVLTHATADFDSLAAAVGLARLWTHDDDNERRQQQASNKAFSISHVPTFVVLPRGAHPGVQRFLALHKHLFPIRSLKSLPADLSGLNRLALVDAQRVDRLGPAHVLLPHAKRIIVVDHHVDQESDIHATDHVVDKVGSVSTLLVEQLQQAAVTLTEAEATLLALGIHADTGSLCFDSTTPRDAVALAWCLQAGGASQAAIAEHAHPFLSTQQQGVLTQALVNVNSTVIHGVTLSTVLLTADGFINGLAAVTQDALELSSSDVFLLGIVYEAQSGSGSGGRRRKKKTRKQAGTLLTSRLLRTNTKNGDHDDDDADSGVNGQSTFIDGAPSSEQVEEIITTQVLPDESKRERRLRQSFQRKDVDGSGYLDLEEVGGALRASGVVCSAETIQSIFDAMDTNGDGRIDLEEFIQFATQASEQQEESQQKKSTTLILIGRAKAGSNLRNIKLNTLLERFGGGGHAKAASATVRLENDTEAPRILQGLVDELVETGLQAQLTVGDFMTAPVLSVKADMTERQVEDIFTRYDVRALPVVDDANNVIGLVTYKEVASAKQRLWNKEQKRLRREQEAARQGKTLPQVPPDRRAGTTVKAWMLQHVKTVEASKTMAEVELILLENDVGCIPVVADGTNQLVGMVTRTDLLRQHRYYNTLHYHNKGFVNSIADRKNIIELRKRLKRFDNE